MNMINFSRRSQVGFALIEALVSLVIMGFGILAMAGMQAGLSRSADDAKQRTEAIRFAQEKIEFFRSFTGIDSTVVEQGAISATALNWNTLAGSTDSITTNAVYTRTWTIGGSASDSMRGLTVNVAWADRTGAAQAVSLSSVLSKSNPADSGFLGFPLPLNTNLKRPKDRNLDIPIPATSIAGTSKSHIQWEGSSGGFLVFSNTSGDIVQKCTATPTEQSLSSDTCRNFDGYLLTGYLTGSNGNGNNSINPVNLVTGINFSETANVIGTPECAVANARDQNSGVIIADTKYYACLIVPTNHDSNTATARVWTGRTDLSGTGTGWNTTKTCRFTSDVSTTVNNKHPARYEMVDSSLDNQNFYITTDTCPASSVQHLANT